ncbi:oligosaccharide repeat unit polymerase [Jeotgalibacillus sp. S-D1]|uniref:O-antigen polymerase n=1 Tax=Jeotgalibacillus sp. S-D1 TaxID=2552189 RepID=UPI001059C169|nr:O-antigen polymerase [Jeotgalibacillus sp. S-D1]TDL32837.1 oligosaccharide repeat unit polymerase [Jeotgalibacillus sp. S-D1]
MEHILLRKGLFYTILSIMSFIVLLTNDFRLILVLYIIVLIFCLFLVRCILHHPFVWFLPFYFLFTCSEAFLMWLEVVPYNINITLALKGGWIGMFVFLIIINPKIENYTNISNRQNNNFIFKVIWYISLILSFVSLISITSSGVSNKREINMQSEQILNSSLSFSLLLLSFAVIVAMNLLNKKDFPYKFVIFNIVFIFFAFLVNGERDLFMRIILITMMLFTILYIRIKPVYIIFFGTIMMVMIPLMHNLKNFWLTKTTNETLSGNIIVDILSGFKSASENLLIVIESNLPYKNGETLIWDILRFFSKNHYSTTEWFNRMFFPNTVATGGGKGFSLLGEGYLNFGIAGMAIWMVILALFIKFLYVYSNKNFITLLLYILSMPAFIYALRADFSNMLSGTIKQALVPLILFYVFYWILTQLLKKDISSKKITLYDR